MAGNSETPHEPDKDGDEKRPVESQRSDWAEAAVLLARVSGIGWFIAGSIGLMTTAGYFLDRHFGTSPIFTLVGLALGLLIAFRGTVGILRSVSRGTDQEKR